MIEDDHAVSGLLDVDLGVIGAHLDGLLDRALAVFGGNLGESPVSRHDHVPGCAKPLGHADAQAHEYDQRSQSPELPVMQERWHLERIARLVSQHGNRFWIDHTEGEIALVVQSEDEETMSGDQQERERGQKDRVLGQE